MSQFGKTEIKIDPDGIIELLKSAEVEAILLDLGEAIAKDAGAKNKKDVYEVKLHRVRKTRSVVNVGTDSEGSFFREAEKGYLAKASRKRRTPRKPRTPKAK